MGVICSGEKGSLESAQAWGNDSRSLRVDAVNRTGVMAKSDHCQALWHS